MDGKNIKEVVKSKYSQIAKLNVLNHTDACNCCSGPAEGKFDVLPEGYDRIDGYLPEADLGLGCGLPTVDAQIKSGDIVLDLGSGAGNDAFIVAKLVGTKGHVIGVDMTSEMISRANLNKEKYNFPNVEFRMGDIEDLPVENETVDIVISNCVINLALNKRRVYQEIYRVLKTGAHFCVSDIVTKGELPEVLKRSAELYTGCLAGALDLQNLKEIIHEMGFKNLQINREKQIILDSHLLKKFLNKNELTKFQENNGGIYSMTISAYK